MAWLQNWSYRKKITISGSTGAGTNYQVLLKVGEGAGATGADFHVEGHSALFPSGKNDSGDLRFTASDGTTLLDFWVEKVEGTAPDRVVWCWVEISADLGTNQDIYCYYGNASATNVSNGDNTFLFFDDFLGTTLDTNKWTTIIAGSGTITVGNDKVELYASGTSDTAAGIRSLIDLPRPYTAEWKFNLTGTLANTVARNRFYLTDGTGVLYYGYDIGLFSNGTTLQQYFNGWTGVPVSDTDEYLMTQKNHGTEALWNYILYDLTTATLTYSADPAVSLDAATRIETTAGTPGATSSATSQINLDWIRVRKYAPLEPAFSSAGGEETPPILGSAVLTGTGNLIVLGGLIKTGQAILSGIGTLTMIGRLRWTKRTKPSTSWTKRTKPVSERTWATMTMTWAEANRSWQNYRDEFIRELSPSTTWTKRVKS